MTKPFDPPYTDIDTEQALLGSLIQNNSVIAGLDLKPEWFFFEPHQHLYAKFQKLFSEKQSFAIADLNEWADGFDMQQQYTAREYIRSLAQGVIPISSSMIDWSFRIADLFRKRCIDDAMTKAKFMLDKNDSGTVLAELHRAISDNSTTPSIRTQGQIHTAIRESLRLPPNRYPTGFKRLDHALGGGLYAGFTYGFCGAEKAGKTTLAHSISYQLECPHLYAAMEMGALQIEQRNMAREGGFNSLMFLDNAKGCEEKIKDIKSKQNVNYLDCPGASCDEILYNVSGAAIKLGIKGFIVDYWQLIGGRQRGDSEEYHLRNAAQQIANFARKHGLWCIILAQMNKGGELFGGNGLKKACDQLFMIEEADADDSRYLKMDASRYTLKVDVGSPSAPGLVIDVRKGPHFYDPDLSRMF